MITRDMKPFTLESLTKIETLVKSGKNNEALLYLSHLHSEISSSMVEVVYSRPEETSRPGDVTSAEELISRNID